MKKITFLIFLVSLVGCADLSQYTTVDSNASAQTKMKACIISEANNRLQNGTLFNGTIKDTAQDIVNDCLSNLALQSLGISAESQTTAENIISGLKNLSSK